MGMAFCALDDLIWDVHITRTPFFSHYPSTLRYGGDWLAII
jgi:hypothetical protein